MNSTENGVGRQRAIGYTRVSTDNQHTRPQDDRARITAACVAFNFELTDFVEDLDVSGKVALADRPNGRRVHELIQAKRPTADVLIVTSLDRLTRESEDGLSIIRNLIPNGRRHPVQLMSLDDHVDLTGAMGRYFAKQRVMMGELERELIGERTSNALRHKRRTGRVYAALPYGWDRVGDHAACEPGHCVCRLQPNPVEQEHLVRMRAWRAEGVNDNVIATRLNAEGVGGKRGGTWQANTVYNILRRADEVGAEVTS
jgi:DNA invertase Pin-like site-specific DNA recombinase